MQAASRSHLERGALEMFVDGSDAECLQFLEGLILTTVPQWSNLQHFLVAESNGQPAGALCGYFAEECDATAGVGRRITSGTFWGNLQRYLNAAGLPPAGVHIFRHSAAKLRRDVGESIEDVSRFLDHSSLAVTTVYLRRLEGQEDRSWGKVAEAIGV